MRLRTIILPELALAALLACGGGGGGGGSSASTTAGSLSFAPGSGTSYRLARNPASTGTTLLLDLYGPTGTKAQGVALFLTADTSRVSWAQPAGSNGKYTLPGTAFNLGSAPQIYAEKLTGADLQVGLFQKSGSVAFAAGKPILTVALSLVAGAAQGDASLSETSGTQAIVLNADGTTSDLPAIDLGTVTIN
jgi:hypothetical protein